MNKITVKIEGMMCGMCEAHICDTIRKALPAAKKVTATRKTGEAIFFLEDPLNESLLRKAISDTGYLVVSVTTQPEIA